MKIVTIHAATAHLSSLLEEVAAGEEVLIAKAGKPIARLVPLEKPDVRKTFGMLEGKIWISDDFDAPLPPEIANPSAWNDGPVAGYRCRDLVDGS